MDENVGENIGEPVGGRAGENMDSGIARLIRKNTLTNYVLVVIRLVEGVLVTRWMYQYLGKEYYGFWALLWSIFIYVLVLDFGFSKAAQKCTAERLFLHDMPHYNRVVSAVFALQWLMSAVIVLVSAVATLFLPFLTGLTDPEQIAYCRLALIVFGTGIAISFPTGMFPEILVGMKAIYLRNYVLVVGRLAEMIGIYVLFKLGGSLLSLIFFSISLNLAINLVMFAIIRRQLPGFRLRPGLCWKTLRELADFSVFSYLNSIGNLIIYKTARVILSIGAGLADVGIYQLGTRIPEMVETMTVQYQDNVAPFTADLCKQNRLDLLRDIIITGLRLTSWLLTGGVAMAIFAAPDMLLFLFGESDPDALAVCRWMLISVFFSVVFRSFAGRIMLMSGHHRMRAIVTWGEAIASLTLSLVLVYRIGLLGVVFGALIPNAVISLFIMLPFLCRFIKYSLWRLFYRVYLFPMLNAIPATLAVWYLQRNLPADWLSFFRLLAMAAVGGGIYSLLSYFDMLSGDDRRKLHGKLRRLIGRGVQA